MRDFLCVKTEAFQQGNICSLSFQKYNYTYGQLEMDKANPSERKLQVRSAIINPWGPGRMNVWSAITNCEVSPAPAAWDSLSKATEKK